VRRVALLSWIFLGSSILVLLLGFIRVGYWQLSLAVLALSIPWFLGVFLNLPQGLAISMVGLTLAAAVGFWLRMWVGWPVLGCSFLLAAWDLQHFRLRLAAAEQILGEQALLRFHLWRLTCVLGIGLLLAGIALLMEVRFSFGIAILLGLLVVLGLRQGIMVARRSNN